MRAQISIKCGSVFQAKREEAVYENSADLFLLFFEVTALKLPSLWRQLAGFSHIGVTHLILKGFAELGGYFLQILVEIY